MDQRDMRAWLDDHLNQVDWGDGLSKAEVVLAVEDDEALRNLVGQYVAEGYYRTPAEVLNVIPEQAWQDAQGDAWHGGDTYDIAGTKSGFRESRVARDHPNSSTSGRDEASGLATGDHRERLDIATEKMVATIQGAVSQAPAIAKQTVGRARSLAADPQDAVTTMPPQVTALLLSALNEGLGQAYNRQPAKAAVFFVTGLGLSTISGYNTWVARNVFGARKVRFGPEHVRPLLVSLWAATYLYNLWDAWINATVDE
jgi:hypothetical protein